MGGRSSTSAQTQTSQSTESTSTGLQDTEGVAIAGGGDVEVHMDVTDQGAVQGAFDFSNSFAQSAFDFASNAQYAAGETAEQAIETTQAALATVATGGQSDMSKIDSKTIAMAIAALVGVMVLPKLLKGAS